MAFKQINTADQNLQLIQSNIDDALRPLQAAPLNDARLITGVALASGQDNLVSHGLGSNLQLWILAGQNTQSTVWSPASSQLGNVSSNDRYLNLRCSSSCTVSLVVA